MHSEDTEKWPAVGSIRTKVAHASQQARRHVLATASWARRQPRSRLVTTAVIIAVTALATWAALALLVSILGYWFGGTEATPAPQLCDRPTVRDDQGRTWQPGRDGQWHTTDGRHHQSWPQLRGRSDLTELQHGEVAT